MGDKTIGSGLYGLKSEIDSLRRLIESYLLSGKPLTPYLQAQLSKLKALTASWNRIMQRIESGEREREFLRPIRTWTSKKPSCIG